MRLGSVFLISMGRPVRSSRWELGGRGAVIARPAAGVRSGLGGSAPAELLQNEVGDAQLEDLLFLARAAGRSAVGEPAALGEDLDLDEGLALGEAGRGGQLPCLGLVLVEQAGAEVGV